MKACQTKTVWFFKQKVALIETKKERGRGGVEVLHLTGLCSNKICAQRSKKLYFTARQQKRLLVIHLNLLSSLSFHYPLSRCLQRGLQPVEMLGWQHQLLEQLHCNQRSHLLYLSLTHRYDSLSLPHTDTWLQCYSWVSVAIWFATAQLGQMFDFQWMAQS